MIKISKIFVVINLVSSLSDFDAVPKEANPFVKSFVTPRLDFERAPWTMDIGKNITASFKSIGDSFESKWQKISIGTVLRILDRDLKWGKKIRVKLFLHNHVIKKLFFRL